MKQLRKLSTVQASFWAAALITGICAVAYAKVISFVQTRYFELYASHPIPVALASPFLFLLATGIVVWFAPQARGSGVPQVLDAIAISEDHPDQWSKSNQDLVSLKTAILKILSSTVGILGGASVGREGPTVQIASSIFASVGRIFRKRDLQVDFSSFLVAGAAAGIAAAFNTPLAGITFAIEELAETAFTEFRKYVIIAVVLAGVAAQAFVGDYLYFGHPTLTPNPPLLLLLQALLLGVVCGILGGGFAWCLSKKVPRILPKTWWKKTLICGAICGALGLATSGVIAGSGYEVTNRFMSDKGDLTLFFLLSKATATVFSYYSGMAGGIFAPSLSVGAGIGAVTAKLFHFINPHACALIGMVAFFSAVVEAPLTAVVIVMEMTDQHTLILPFLLAAFLAQAVGKRILPTPLYRSLMNNPQGSAHAPQ